MNEPEKSRPPLTVHAPLQLEPGRGFQFIEFKPGMTGVVESGRVMKDVPAVRKSGDKPPEAGVSRAGEKRGVTTLDAGEQAWFRDTFCNGAQACVQGWDWAVATSDQTLGSGTGFAMVGFTAAYGTKLACKSPDNVSAFGKERTYSATAL